MTTAAVHALDDAEAAPIAPPTVRTSMRVAARGAPAVSASLSPVPTAPPDIGGASRRLGKPRALPDASMGTMRYQTPLRYPGAKSGLVRHIAALVASASASLGRPRLLVEPFAGGASTSLRLTGEGLVDRVLLADADPLVARFWQVAAADTDWLIDRMWDEPVTLERWDHWRAYTPRGREDREIAVKCLFLNRTTFSGILHGRAGPIGGRAQASRYAIDCRFNKEGLERRLRYVGDLYTANRLIDVWCADWQHTLDEAAKRYPQLLPDRVVAYLDPPYLEKSPKLYGRSFDPSGGYSPARRGVDAAGWREGSEHRRLAAHLRGWARYRWVLSYDDHPDLTTDPGLYAAGRMTPDGEARTNGGVRAWRIAKWLVPSRYTASGSRSRGAAGAELLLTTLPCSRIARTGALVTLTAREG